MRQAAERLYISLIWRLAATIRRYTAAVSTGVMHFFFFTVCCSLWRRRLIDGVRRISGSSRWARTGVLLTALTLARLQAAEEPFAVVVELNLQPPVPPASAWTVAGFTAQSSKSVFPQARFEQEGRLLSSISRRLRPVGAALPIDLERLMATIQRIDPDREWLPLDDFSPRAGFQFALLRYRLRSKPFTIRVHPAGQDSAAPEHEQIVPVVPPVRAVYRANPSLAAVPAFAAAIERAAGEGLGIAQRHGLIAGSASGDTRKIRIDLEGHFRLVGLAGTALNYRVEEMQGQAVGLTLEPVIIPQRIEIELGNWAAEEARYGPATAERLRAKRLERQQEIHAEFSGIFPTDVTLVTAETIAQWRDSAPGRRYGIAPVRYERDALVLNAADFLSRTQTTLVVGAAYGATDGLQGTASVRLMHERRTHLDLELDASAGEKAQATSARLGWFPVNRIAGWKITTDGSLDAFRHRRAYFSETVEKEPVRWEQWRGNLGVTLSRSAGEPEAGAWKSGISAALHLIHTDDTIVADEALPADAALPDSLVELQVEWRTQTILTERRDRLGFHARLELSESVELLGGNYEYHRVDVQIGGQWITDPTQGRSWKFVATTRAGRLSGRAPLSRQFRAGGDEGWIRGLREGELTGSAYWSHSFAAGPEISSLLGRDSAGRPPAYLLAFWDGGEVRDEADRRRRAQGYGVALNLDDLPVGEGLTASLFLGYAYSPDSRADRHGAFFIRLDLPFTN